MKPHSRFAVARKILLFWCLFIGVGAVAGAAGMLAAPDGSVLGMQALLPYFQVLPFSEALFQNFVFPGISLLCVNGLTNLTAAALLLLKKRAGVLLGGLFGVTLMLWICIQFVIFPPNFMSTTYFFFGLVQAATGYAAWVFREQETFAARAEQYPNIGTDPKRLVICFSRMGYTKKIACEIADASGAALYEVRAAEPTAGTPGFWWCGRYGMHGWPMPIEPVELPLSSYAQVTVCSPVWVFGLSGPMRSFCAQAAGQLKNVDLVLVHFQRIDYQRVFSEMDALLKTNHTHARSVCCRFGRVLRDVTL